MTELPGEMQELTEKLRKAQSRDICLRMAYDSLARRFRAPRLGWVTFWDALERDALQLWHRRRLTGVQLNALLRELLVESGHFQSEDIEERWTAVWLLPHQYLLVRVDDETMVRVDVWGARRGVPYDSHARGFI